MSALDVKVRVTVRDADAVRSAIVSSMDGVLTLGRHPESSICLEGMHVSRVHARVQVTAEALRVQDVSSNGTNVDGRLLVRDSTEIPFGAPIGIGPYTVAIEPAGDGADRAAGSGRSTSEADLIAPSTPEPVALDPGNIDLRREIHRQLLANLDLVSLDPRGRDDDPTLRPRVAAAIRKVVRALDARIPASVDRAALVTELVDEAVGLGPLEQFLSDPSVTEIMVVDPVTIYVERAGKLVKTAARFTDDERVRAVVERIVTPLGRRIDESSPLVDARLADGARVNAVIPPLALRGTCITIRKFTTTALTLERLVEFDALTTQMARFLVRCVKARKNIVIAGGTGSGKTTLLNVLSQSIPAGERIVTIEDAAELRLSQPHVVSLETRPPNMEGKGEFSIRSLVKNALRMRPDRIIVGECRGGEALDMLQAMNTGHDGSLTTTHANSPAEAISRLETLVLMAGLDLPIRAVRDQIAGAVDILVQQTRYADGSRRVEEICEVTGVGDDGQVAVVPLFRFVRTGVEKDGRVRGEFRHTGLLPSFLYDFVVMGLVAPGEDYL